MTKSDNDRLDNQESTLASKEKFPIFALGCGVAVLIWYALSFKPEEQQTAAAPAPACVQHEFEPQKDISGWEVAFILKNSAGFNHRFFCIDDKTWGELDPKIKRNFK